VRLSAGIFAYRSKSVIDLHCHVLPGIDDGPETIEGSLALARGAVAAGIQTVVATPHVSRRYPNDGGVIARLVDEVNARLAAESVALEIQAGAEIAMTRLVDIEPARLSRLSLGEGPWLLVEPPFTAIADSLGVILAGLQHRGHRIVLAHPERCHAFHRDPQMLGSLVRAGVLTSITAGSLAGRFGSDVRRFALALARDGMIHNVTSDAHDHVHRPPGIMREIEQAGLGPLAEWLTETVPAAILDGSDTIPSRPSVNTAHAEPVQRRRWLPLGH
jgi:protein-tyrosine phosphatase